jgi:hypothetical protein
MFEGSVKHRFSLLRADDIRLVGTTCYKLFMLLL